MINLIRISFHLNCVETKKTLIIVYKMQIMPESPEFSVPLENEKITNIFSD